MIILWQIFRWRHCLCKKINIVMFTNKEFIFSDRFQTIQVVGEIKSLQVKKSRFFFNLVFPFFLGLVHDIYSKLYMDIMSTSDKFR